MKHITETVLPRAYYCAPIAKFSDSDPRFILGMLSENSEHAVEPQQRDAWLGEIGILQQSLNGLQGELFLEFNIPRMGRRIDALVVSGPVIFILEFKVGESKFLRADLDQVWDYALDLKNFHKGSHTVRILPILIATHAQHSFPTLPSVHEDLVYNPAKCATKELRNLIDLALLRISGPPIDVATWAASAYHPTPTIVEAAQNLYASHSVEAIARHDAGATNLRVTSKRVEDIVEEARTSGQKRICFVTGVPGAGKTLVGLNIATQKIDKSKPTHAVFLSGNAPLVAVLREALVRDQVTRQAGAGVRILKKDASETVKAFIQNVHHFRDEALRDPAAPVDRVVIFDEAQRAWNKKQTASFMIRKKKVPGFNQSEPEFLISYLDRHKDWAVIICLVGGGQEINTGEAGIAAWLDAIRTAFPDWHIDISHELRDTEYAAGEAIDLIKDHPKVRWDRDLHLAVSMRSFRADNVSAFVKAVLDIDKDGARSALKLLQDRYPIVLTRCINKARHWIRERARGTERYGLLASSEAQRLKPHAIDVRVQINPVHWFLNERTDTRSSYYLEDAATEFQVQGLELDWACVTWDGDLRFSKNEWAFHSFCGSKWQNIHKSDRREYLRNAYRVLLTRARQGMVLFIPEGCPEDPTRNASYYDPTFNYLRGLGIPIVE